MSGICAILWKRDQAKSARETLAAMSSGLAFPGEGSVSCQTDGGAGVAVVARFARQQIYSSERLQLACDAELYNEKELAHGTDQRMAVEAGAGVAALLAGLYERFGPEFVEKLRGAFSFVLWDRIQRKLLAAVDGFGVNRLVYSDTGKAVVVGSRIDALVRSGEVETQINPRSVANVLNFTANMAPETIFTSVRRLIPGGCWWWTRPASVCGSIGTCAMASRQGPAKRASAANWRRWSSSPWRHTANPILSPSWAHS